METLWIAVFAALLVGYFALEGFSIGTGLLLPFVSRDERDRATVVAALGPYFLANEVWLVAAVGVFFGVFPALEGAVLTGLFPVVVAFLLAWLIRDAGLWMRARRPGERWRGLWDRAIFLGSLGMAALWGVALANLVVGLPLDHGAPEPGSLFHVYALAGAVTVPALLAAHGAAWLARRVDDVPGREATRLGTPLCLTAAGMLTLATVLVPAFSKHAPVPGWWIGVAAAGVCAVLWAARRFGSHVWKRPGHPGRRAHGVFALTMAGAVAPAAAILGGALDVLRAGTAPAESLWVLTVVGGPALPLLALAQIWLWRAFRGTVDRTTPSYL